MEELEENQERAQESEQPVSPEHLKEQVKSFHELPQVEPEEFRERPLPGWKEILYLVLVFGVLFCVVFLLIFDRSRRQLIASIGEGFSSVYGVEQDEILRLPPPPPKAVQTRAVIPSGSIITAGADEEPGGVLFLDKTPPALGREEEPPPAQVILAKNSFNEAAYDFLRATSEVVAELTENSIPEFDFRDWRPVKDDRPESWIDLIASRRSDGQDIHLIWSVNTETKEIRALSQAARDLEASR